MWIDYESEGSPPTWLRRYLPHSVKGWEQGAAWPWFMGANYAAFVEQVVAVGGMNVGIGPGAIRAGTAENPLGLERDLQERLAAAGCEQVYLPEAEVWHHVPKSSCTPASALHRQYRNAMTAAIRPDARHPHRLGNPGRLWVNLPIALLRCLKAQFVNDEERRFRLKLAYHPHRGFLRGRRLRSAIMGGPLPIAGAGDTRPQPPP